MGERRSNGYLACENCRHIRQPLAVRVKSGKPHIAIGQYAALSNSRGKSMNIRGQYYGYVTMKEMSRQNVRSEKIKRRGQR